MSDKELKQPTKQDVLDYIKKGLQKKEDTLNVSIELDEKEEKDISKDVEEAKAQVEGGEIKQDRVHIPPSENKASSENLDAFDESRLELLKKYNLIPSKSEMEGFLKDTLFSRPIEFDVSIINGLVKAHYKSISNKANMLVADLRKDLDMYSRKMCGWRCRHRDFGIIINWQSWTRCFQKICYGTMWICLGWCIHIFILRIFGV